MLLPSPTTSDANGAGAHGAGGSDLRTTVAHDLMPTPRAGDGEKGGPNQRGSSGDLMLPSAVHLLGTPTARDHKGSGQGERLEESERRGQVEAQVLALEGREHLKFDGFTGGVLSGVDLNEVAEVGGGFGAESDGHGSTLAPDFQADLAPESKDFSLLPTPAVNDMGAAYDPAAWDRWTARMKAAHNNGNGHGPSLNIEAQRLDLLPTIRTKNNENRQSEGFGGEEGNFYGLLHNPSRWGKYAAAIARWESITRPAPEPTNITEGYLKARAKRLARLDSRPVGMRGSLKVRRQLAARFSEWMMGVPLGWITDVPGVSRNEALKAAGNGVVPQQAAEALRFLLEMPTGRDVADAHEPVDLFELMAVDS